MVMMLSANKRQRLDELPRHNVTKGSFSITMMVLLSTLNHYAFPGSWSFFPIATAWPYALALVFLTALSQAAYVISGWKRFLELSTTLMILIFVGFGTPFLSIMVFGG